MKRFLRIELALVLTAWSAIAAAADDAGISLPEAVEQSAKKIAAELPKGSRVALVAFESENNNLSDFIMEELTGALISRGMEAADRQNLAYVYKELDLQISGGISDETSQSVGKFLGAQFAITGQLAGIGDSYRYHVSTINVEKGEQKNVTPLTVRKDGEIQNIITALARQKNTNITAKYGVSETITPETAGTFLDRGILFASRGDSEKAIADFTEALKLNQNLIAAYILRGRALYSSVSKGYRVIDNYSSAGIFSTAGKAAAEKERVLRQAIADFTAALRMEPNNASLYVERGRAYSDKGDTDKAIADFNHVIETNLNIAFNAAAYINRGIAYDKKGETDRAIADFNQAIKLDPNDAAAYNNRGVEYDNKGETDRAIADYSQAIKLDPNYADAYYNRSGAYYDKGDYDRLIADLNQAIKLDPNHVDAYYNRGNAYADKGDYDKAIENYSQVVKLDPNDATAYHNRGCMYGLKGETDRAIADYSQAVKLYPNYAEAYYNRGNAYADKGDYDKAIADYTQAFKMSPNPKTLDFNYSFVYNSRGSAYYRKGDYDKAIEDYSQAVKLDLNYAIPYYNRGIAYDDNGDYDLAIADFNQFIKLNPNDAAAYCSRGSAYYGKGDYDKAIEDFSQAVKLNPDYANAYYSRGIAYSNKGDYIQAITNYEEALRIDPNHALAKQKLEAAREALER